MFYYTFSVVYFDDLKHGIDGTPERGAKEMTVEQESLEDAITEVQTILALENKTLISVRLLVIEVSD